MSEQSEFVSGIEQELLDATNFIPEKKYRKRQDYLGALLRAVSELADEDYDKLSDEAAEWCDAAVTAHKANKTLPDFENGEDHDPETEPEGHSTQYELASESAEESEGLPDEQGEDSTEPEKKEKKKRGRPKGSKGKVAKAKVVKIKKEPGEKKGRIPSRGFNEWGVANGTKSDLVCRMLAQEGGTTMNEIVQATGQAHYNLVHRLARYGHTVVKDGLNLRLFHKDKPRN